MLEAFGTIPSPPRLNPTPNHLQRFQAAQQARAVLELTISARKYNLLYSTRDIVVVNVLTKWFAALFPGDCLSH